MKIATLGSGEILSRGGKKRAQFHLIKGVCVFISVKCTRPRKYSVVEPHGILRARCSLDM